MQCERTYTLDLDFTKLHESKRWLEVQAITHREGPAESLLGLLDAIMDQAIDTHGLNRRQVMGQLPADSETKARLEELREVLRDECISYGELAELQDLACYIEEGDVELLEPAGVPEFDEVDDN